MDVRELQKLPVETVESHVYTLVCNVPTTGEGGGF